MQAGNCKTSPLFQSTLPVWGGTLEVVSFSVPYTISIHPPRVGRDVNLWQIVRVIEISIHPPRVGRDYKNNLCKLDFRYFNPPSPCGEGQKGCCSMKMNPIFQSTLPVWGGTQGLQRQ